MKEKELQEKVRDCLTSLGFNLNGEMKETPRRIVDLYHDMMEGCNIDLKRFFQRPLQVKHDEMVVIKNIEFVSWCCHHLWPFFGKVHIAFIPRGKIIGLSKFLSVVRALSRRPQVQETMTTELANVIEECLEPLGLMVIIEATHTCMLVGGRYDYGMPAHTEAKTVTSAVRGVFLNFDTPRMEALRLIYSERR